MDQGVESDRAAGVETPRLREVGTSGIRVSPIGIDGSIFGWAAADDATAAVLDRLLAAGGNLVSTSDHYAGGRSEIMIGTWLRTLPDRSAAVIATKVGRHPDASGLGASSILRAVDASLERLGTDYIDILSFAGDHPQTPLEESLAAAEQLIRDGRVRAIGLSDYAAPRIMEAHRIAAVEALPRPSAFVVDYNLMEREDFEANIQPFTLGGATAALVRQPLAGGYLTGRFRTRDDIPRSILFGGAIRHIGRSGTKVLDALDTIAAELDETPPRIALAWLLVKPGVASAIVRVDDSELLDGLLGADSIALERHHVTALDKASQ